MSDPIFDLEATQPLVVISVDLVHDDAFRRPSSCDDLFGMTAADAAP